LSNTPPIQQYLDIGVTLEGILEHGAEAWALLRQAGLAPAPREDGFDSWPPELPHTEAGTIAYHVAAMIQYAKREYDRRPL
jgi:hypothetical protein